MGITLFESNFERQTIRFFRDNEEKAWYVDEASIKGILDLPEAEFATRFNQADYRVFTSKKGVTHYMISTIDLYLTLQKYPFSLWVHDEEFIYLPRRAQARRGVASEKVRSIETTTMHLQRYLTLYNKKGARYFDTIIKTANRLEEMIQEIGRFGFGPQNRTVLEDAMHTIEEARQYDEQRKAHNG